MYRVGLIAVVIEDRESTVQLVNSLFSDFSKIIIGRMGIPYEKRDLHLICLMVDGTTDEIGSLTGKLGMIPTVSVSTNLVKSKRNQKEFSHAKK
ncbi:MAG: iron-only hydrogenase system regulator [Caldisericia bacterium]|nr:iron-only hydrogenase system regulator [Caldisericia bacterium]